MQFEVRVPDVHNASRTHVLVVEARDWFSALRNALKEKGEDNPLRNVLCDLVSEGVYRVTETEGGRIFEIHEVPEDEQDIAFAPPEPMADSSTQTDLNTVRHEPARAHTLQPLDDQPSPSPAAHMADMDVSSTIMDLPPIQVDAVAEVQMPEKKRKKDLASTMLMDFAAIIEAEGEDSGHEVVNSKTIEFRDFASKEEIEREKPSVIISEDAYTPAPPSKLPGGRDVTPTIRQGKQSPPQNAADDELSQLTGASGKYKPGMTTEMLADVFMRAADIADFGGDISGAMQFVLDLALGDVKAAGGGVLLTDLNSPDQDLWFEVAAGPGSDIFRNFRIPLGQGIIGYYTQQGVNQVISDVQKEPRFGEDIMRQAGVAIGPMLCAPMSYNDRVWGCVLLFNEPGSRPFTQGELSIMTYLAYTAGEYLCSNN